MWRILVADDDAADRELMVESLAAIDGDLEVATAVDGAEACDLVARDEFDVVFTDLKMPGTDGLGVVRAAVAAEPAPEVVIVTGFGDVPTAVEAMKQGCFDYLLKPICMDQVEVVLDRVRDHRRLVRENAYLHAELDAATARKIVGESAVLQDLIDRARQVAGTDATVLLRGESGTGKELVSRLIHRSSPRRDGPFVRVNCAALSESILESELFGHEKGAFTGATARKPGRFELADGGTLLLDEITETSEKLQAELLRVIEEREFERVGGTRTIRVDLRVIATTNRDLEAAVADGRFREDLYYRLNVVPLLLPPLREREGDCDLLLDHFVRRFARELGRPAPRITDAARGRLRRYRWPGNVRELENMVQRLVIMDRRGVIDEADLPPQLGPSPAGRPAVGHHGDPFRGTLEDAERVLILHALRVARGNRTRAAAKLDISTRTIRNKLKKYAEQGSLPEDLS